MRALLLDIDDNELGAISVIDGKARPTNDFALNVMKEIPVTDPDDHDKVLTQNDGETYVAALPFVLKSPYLRALVQHP